MRLLLIEDEPHLGAAVREHLAAAGHAVDWMPRLDEAEAALRAVAYDVVLLDLHLPDGRGADLLRAMRARGDRRPVIILTARDRISDRIEGLNAGADDYLVKPFDLDELVARLLAVARRYGGDPSPVVRRGRVAIDRAARRASLDGTDVVLTGREWAIVDLLLQRPEATLAKDRIEDALYAFGAEIESNAVEVYVSRLRKKLGRGFIETVRGVGYRLGA
ncbi:MAG: response regulator transcription factor [Alphaproteobacteria bacterium]